MSRREAWKGASPDSSAAARQHLLAAAQACIERYGFSKVTLSDVATEAGVTRPTVYRYFGSADELFVAAAVTASGGFLERARSRVARLDDPIERVVETLAILIAEVPEDPYLGQLFQMRDVVSVRAQRQNAFVANELRLHFGDRWRGDDRDMDDVAEFLLRLLTSFLDDPGPERDVRERRRYLTRVIEPVLRPHCA